ncbi:MAG TPA: helix-turn-helix domain-containing protein [Pseudonocardia sp.]|jgi:TetR/AcrR family transcriptional regulator, transcriptional repressor of aconitase|uniref:TetR/AcrR family transcriptional regulator n=1 Tax=Pseudonocardia sp. TaxID=60912 RepID=UPI002D0104F1|nr:helix-turn-helix domain-containing protein [Pseudonocardia sp.]HTF53967.1 helix-turn-helix domain-containing protein [Pseudonocardia sp.]
MPRVSAGHLAARREQILDGARACFSRYGYEGATVRRLEEATGMSRGAIFHHFKDKDSLFLELAHQDARRMAQVVSEQGLVQVMRDILADAAIGGSGISWLGTRLEVSRRLRTDQKFRADWEQHAQELTDAIQRRLTRQREAGVVRRDLPVPVLTRYLELSFEGLVSHLAMGLPADDLRAVLDVVESSVRRPAPLGG